MQIQVFSESHVTYNLLQFAAFEAFCLARQTEAVGRDEAEHEAERDPLSEIHVKSEHTCMLVPAPLCALWACFCVCSLTVRWKMARECFLVRFWPALEHAHTLMLARTPFLCDHCPGANSYAPMRTRECEM